MGKTIWKFPINLHTDRPKVLMPVGAEIISMQLNQGQLTFWAVVDADRLEEEERRFRILITGYTVSDEEYARLKYIGTWQLSREADSPAVFHVFEKDAKE